MQAETLIDHIKFDHGYTAKSPAVINVCFFSRFTKLMQEAFILLYFIQCHLLFLRYSVTRDYGRIQPRAAAGLLLVGVWQLWRRILAT